MAHIGSPSLLSIRESSFGLAFVALIGIVLGGVGCASTSTADRQGLEARFVAAVRDAGVAEPFEVERGLKAVTPYEPGLVWQGLPGEAPVRVLAWVGEGALPTEAGATAALEAPLAVTLVPELAIFCRSRVPRREEERSLRLEQLLGLPPAGGGRFMVELWVATEDLYRACPDPEVTDHECTLVPPAAAGRVTVTGAHAEELESLRRGAGPERKIWTHLGYTYDWGNPRSEVGLSEFVVREGASVEVHRAMPTLEYCQRR